MHHTDRLSGRLAEWSVRRPFFVVGLAAVPATAAALRLPLWASLALAAVLVCSGFVGRWRLLLWRLGALSAAVFLCAVAGYRQWVVAPLAALDGQTDTLTGQVVALPQTGRMVTVEVTGAQRVPQGTAIALYLPEELAPLLGDTVTAQVTLSGNLPSSYAPTRGVHLYAFPLQYDDRHVQVIPGTPSWSARWGDRLYAGLRRVLPGQEGDVLAALCLGRDASLPAGIQTAFRDSGLGHLLVVSGLHLSLVVLALRTFFRRVGVGRRFSAVLTIPVMGLFMALVGVSPSVMRAGTMALCWLIGLCVRRRSEGINALGLAAAVVLLQNPYQLYSAGFQLSFLATAGVLCLSPRLCGWLYRRPLSPVWGCRMAQRAGRFAYSAAAVCFSAVLFTLPVSCYYFGGFPAASLLSNLLAVVPAGWVLLCGWVGILCAGVPFLAWAAQPILWLAGVGARYLTQVARWCCFGGARIEVATLWQWLLLTGVCLLLLYVLMTGLSLRRTLPPLLAVAVLGLSAGRLLASPAVRLTVMQGDVGVLVLLEQGENTALLATHSQDLADAARLMERRHCHRLDWLVVEDGQLMDAGALAAIYHQAGQPRVGTTDPEAWFAGVTFPVERLPYATAVRLWERCTLTPATKTWWRLSCGGEPVLVGSDVRVPCPYPEGLTVYAGVPRRAQSPAVVVCPPEDLVGNPLDYAGDALLLTDEEVTFTIRPDGEWSVLPWL